MTDFVPTRAAALGRLAAFVPRAGSDYANHRNADLGPARRDHVSGLSPALRHRLIGEDEVVRAVLERHSLASAEKFVQEVCWRSYWKGWLELRPGVWHDYRAQLDALLATVGDDDGPALDRPLRRRWRTAIAGETGIDCFDAWARELVDTGYLHNHARMWFASIWIFTLKLPWPLGADFFLRHLLDGDPASNTLSWRWVAGLHTRGKHYVARADNIRQCTGGRWWPRGQLDEDAAPLPPDTVPAAGRLAPLPPPRPGLRTALWLHEDDLGAERWPLPSGLDLVAVGGDADAAARAWLPVSPCVADYTEGALADGLARAGRHFDRPAQRVRPSMLHRWLADHGIEQLVTAQAPVGPGAGRLAALGRELTTRGILLSPVRHDWDSAFWPHAAKGYFQLRAMIPAVLHELGIP